MKKIRSVVVALGCVGMAACSGGSDSASAAVTLSGPGFAAATLHGTAGGPQAGSALGSDCIGQFPSSPQHTVTVSAAIPMLRVLVNGGPSADTTLAVRRPDGTVVCNDDSGDPGNGLNPAVDISNAAPGQYQVFVGGYSTGDTWASYNLGFSENPSQYASQVVANP